MCGIAGIVGHNADRHVDAVRRMTVALRHRGLDGSGIHVAASGKCVLGHRRLAILDLTQAGQQPMTTDGGRFALSYNGECYNFAELRRVLEADGRQVDSSGDTEVVLKALASKGASVLPSMNGMFALALWDDHKQSMLLARDRFGQKPLYYAQVDGLFVFASEVRAVLASGLLARRASLRGIVGFLSFGSVQGPDTIVDGVSLLEEGTYLRVQPDCRQPIAQTFWTAPTDKCSRSDDELRDLFATAVDRHLLSDAPIGVFLSGGIDSAAIVAAAARTSGHTVKSLCVTAKDSAELCEGEQAKRIAHRVGSEHVEFPVGNDELAALVPAAIAAMDQPTVDGINTFIASYAARQVGLKATLSGLGGDELFGGYRSSFHTTLQMRRWSRRLGPLRGPAAAICGRIASMTRLASRPSKVADMLSSPGDLISSYLVRRKLLTSSQLGMLFPGLHDAGWCDGLSDGQRLHLHDQLQSRDATDALGLLEMRHYMAQQLLRDSDVMGMAHGLEIRMPFLDADFSRAVLMLESSTRTPGLRQKERLVRCLGDWLPPDIGARPKQGFLLAMEDAMRGPLAGRVWQGLTDLERFGNAVDHDSVRRQWTRFRAGDNRFGWTRLWALSVLGEYLREHDLCVEWQQLAAVS